MTDDLNPADGETEAPGPVRIRVRVFASLARQLGASRKTIGLTLPTGATVADALATLGQRHPAVAKLGDRLAVAVNHAYASPNRPLSDGDELALIPPVSGG